MFQINPNWFQIDPWLMPVVIIAIIAFIVISVYWGMRAHRRQVAAGREDLIGKSAEVKEALKPKGVVFVEGERWTAISEQGKIQPGEEVLITKVDGLKLWVTKKQ